MELMIVMAIIAIASAVIIPRISNSEGKLFRAQLRTLAATINYNRRNAIIRNRPFVMNIIPYTGQDDQLLQSVNKRKGDWISQGADVQWKTGTRLINNKPFNITYFPQGGATGGTIRLQQGRFAAHLQIDGITGKVTIEQSHDEPQDETVPE